MNNSRALKRSDSTCVGTCCTTSVFYSSPWSVITPWAIQSVTKFHYFSANPCHFLDRGDDIYLDAEQKNNREKRASVMQPGGGEIHSKKLLGPLPHCFSPFSQCACQAGSWRSLVRTDKRWSQSVSQLQDLAFSWTERCWSPNEHGNIRDVKQLHLFV